MKYLAGTYGLGRFGIPNRMAHWYCSCGKWMFTAVAMSNRRSGNNRIEADRDYMKHLYGANWQRDPHAVRGQDVQ